MIKALNFFWVTRDFARSLHKQLNKKSPLFCNIFGNFWNIIPCLDSGPSVAKPASCWLDWNKQKRRNKATNGSPGIHRNVIWAELSFFGGAVVSLYPKIQLLAYGFVVEVYFRRGT